MVFKSKHGVGIMEVMIAALVLGLLYTAVSNLQRGNREALLRIRGRDGATEVAQNVIDSLGALGLANFSNDNLIENTDGTWSLAKVTTDGSSKTRDTIFITRTWEGQPGLMTNTMSVKYTVVVNFSADSSYQAKTGSLLLGNDCTESSSNCVSHVYAKRLDVSVSWPYKASRQSISVSGVIR